MTNFRELVSQIYLELPHKEKLYKITGKNVTSETNPDKNISRKYFYVFCNNEEEEGCVEGKLRRREGGKLNDFEIASKGDVIFRHCNTKLVGISEVLDNYEGTIDLNSFTFPKHVVMKHFIKEFNRIKSEKNSPFSDGDIKEIEDKKRKVIHPGGNRKFFYEITRDQAIFLLDLVAVAGGVKTPAEFAYNLATTKLESPLELSFYNGVDYKSAEEEKNHEKFVKEYLDPKGYKYGRNKVYACIENNEDPEDKSVRLSLMTPGMLQADLCFLDKTSCYEKEEANFISEETSEKQNQNRENIEKETKSVDAFEIEPKPDRTSEIQIKEVFDELYRPYFYELVLDVNEDNSEWSEWLAEVDKYYEEKEVQEKWFAIEIGKNQDGLKGWLSFVGSEEMIDEIQLSFKYLLSYAEYLDFKKASEIITKSKNINPNKLFRDFIDQITQVNVEVWNVGEANCIKISSDNGAFFFDIGAPRFSFKKDGVVIYNNDRVDKTGWVWKNLERLKNEQPSFIIISHWHYDHFAGFTKLTGKCQKNTLFIAPSMDKSDKYLAKKMAFYLDKKNNLISIDKTQSSANQPLFRAAEIELWVGDHTDYNNYKNDVDEIVFNDMGLILRIKDAVFPGDCTYRSWPIGLQNKMNNLKKIIVPHHCAGINKDESQMIQGQNDKNYYICSGENDNNHPNTKHKNHLSLNSNNITVYQTGGNVGAQDMYPFSINL